MKINESRIDRVIRVVAGIGLLAFGLLTELAGALPWIAIGLGAILVVTGIVGFCPLYAIFKFSTNKK
jgi:fatty acid desaturase